MSGGALIQEGTYTIDYLPEFECSLQAGEATGLTIAVSSSSAGISIWGTTANYEHEMSRDVVFEAFTRPGPVGQLRTSAGTWFFLDGAIWVHFISDYEFSGRFDLFAFDDLTGDGSSERLEGTFESVYYDRCAGLELEAQ